MSEQRGLVDPLQRAAVAQLLAHADVVDRVERRRCARAALLEDRRATLAAQVSGIVLARLERAGIAVVRPRVDLALESRARERRVGVELPAALQADTAVVVLR